MIREHPRARRGIGDSLEIVQHVPIRIDERKVIGGAGNIVCFSQLLMDKEGSVSSATRSSRRLGNEELEEQRLPPATEEGSTPHLTEISCRRCPGMHAQSVSSDKALSSHFPFITLFGS
jgi:hypothetical protein